jgi:hypothetical protein
MAQAGREVAANDWDYPEVGTARKKTERQHRLPVVEKSPLRSLTAELPKLGIAVAQSTAARYLTRPRKPPCQTLRTFLTNHLAETAAIDFFTVPTATSGPRC